MLQRFENVHAVDVEIDADGWPHVTIYPSDSEQNAHVIFCRPKGNAEILKISPDTKTMAESAREARAHGLF